jgi:hypothetical protein
MRKTLLRELSAATIVARVCDAAERWSDADFPPRVRVTHSIRERLGYSLPVVEYALDRLFFSLGPAAIEAAIVDELGSLRALDGFAPRPGRPASYARGVEKVVIVSSDTTIGVAIVPAVYALCAKCNVVVTDRGDALVAAFFASLAEEHDAFGAAAVARTWAGGDDPQDSALLGQADVVVAFAADPALRAIRGQVRAEARFVPFGHRASIGYLDAAGIPAGTRTALLEGIAADALLYDGDGCLSLHAMFVAGDAATIGRVSVEFPPSDGDPERAAGGRGAIAAPARAGAMIAFDPPRTAPPPFVPRVLPVFPVGGPQDVVAYVRAHRLAIAALGVADTHTPELCTLAEAIGAVRIAQLGLMQAPPVGGHHGGAPRIADFVRWIDRE